MEMVLRNNFFDKIFEVLERLESLPKIIFKRILTGLGMKKPEKRVKSETKAEATMAASS